eukprot:1561774-Rhodomonas_salina.2
MVVQPESGCADREAGLLCSLDTWNACAACAEGRRPAAMRPVAIRSMSSATHDVPAKRKALPTPHIPHARQSDEERADCGRWSEGETVSQ